MSQRDTLGSGPSPSTDVSTRSSLVEVSHLRGLRHVSIYQFKGIQDLQEHVEKQSDALRDGHTTNQYLDTTLQPWTILASMRSIST